MDHNKKGGAPGEDALYRGVVQAIRLAAGGAMSEQAPGQGGPEPTRWGIALFFCSLVSAIALIAIARGWL